MLTKVNYLNQRSEDGGGLGCTLGPRIKELLHLKQIFLRESSVNPNMLPWAHMTYLPLNCNCSTKQEMFSYQTMFLVALKKKQTIYYGVYVAYCRRLKSQYLGPLKVGPPRIGDPKKRGPQETGPPRGCGYCGRCSYATVYGQLFTEV